MSEEHPTQQQEVVRRQQLKIEELERTVASLRAELREAARRNVSAAAANPSARFVAFLF